MRAAVCMLLFTLWPFSAVAETGHPAASAAVLVAGPVAATLTGPDQTAARNALAQYPDPPDTGTPEPEPPKPEPPKRPEEKKVEPPKRAQNSIISRIDHSSAGGGHRCTAQPVCDIVSPGGSAQPQKASGCCFDPN